MMRYKGYYWALFAPLMKRSIRRRYGGELAERAIREGKAAYRKLLRDADPIGDDNPMAMNAYFAYVFVAAWLGSGKAIPPEGMGEVMKDVLAVMKPFFGTTNLNSRSGATKWYRDMKKYEAWYGRNGGKYPTTWKVHFDEARHRDGSFYYFTACPICAYMDKLGYSEIMPALCATDEVMFKYQHGVLHRQHTLARGEAVCDYWVVGDQVKDPQ